MQVLTGIAMQRIRCGLASRVGCSVLGLCDCLLATRVNHTNTAEPIEMSFGYGVVGHKEPCIMWGSYLPHREGYI